MKGKILAVALVIMVVFQVVFSFYYSSEIVEENRGLYQNQERLTELLLGAEKLNEKWSEVSSLKALESKIENLGLVPIEKTFDNE